MSQSVQALCAALKKIMSQLKPQSNALSFVLVVGKVNQGKTALLQQGKLERITIATEQSAEIYYNQHGILIELCESWLHQSNHLLERTLKQLNRCHRSLKINGIILCIDINALFHTEPSEFTHEIKTHTHLIERFGSSLGYKVDVAIVFTKLDALAGFCDFFQNEHANELSKPLGFSLYGINQRPKLIETYKLQFEHFIETLGQQVINKIHPVRSSIKRTLIREFPLQLSTLRVAIQVLLQNISPQLFNVQTLYFTSSEQGGLSLDRLNKKIQQEYALTVQDAFPQSTNYRTYFVEGALHAFQDQTKSPPPSDSLMTRWPMGLVAAVVGISAVWLTTQYIKSSQLLDKTGQELTAYDALMGQKGKSDTAMYHLNSATSSLEQISSSALMSPTVQQLKTQVHVSGNLDLHSNFLPARLKELEDTITNSQYSHAQRYQALKIYLMFHEPKTLVLKDVSDWFRQQWNNEPKANIKQKLDLLTHALQQPFQPIAINQQVVSDLRNYLNALPVTYLYYALAKEQFPTERQPITIDGFSLSEKSIPVYVTKSGFQHMITLLPNIAARLQADNWVLARQDLGNLQALLQEAYCHEYTTWWQNFIRTASPIHAKNYQEARELTQLLYQSRSITTLIELLQQQTGPELHDNATLFNQEIASKFTSLNLMSRSALQGVTDNIDELEKFLTTLAILNDQGKTAFALVKARFENDAQSSPLSAMYTQAKQLPEPAASFAKQIANDIWFILISDSRNYINQQWKQNVYPNYTQTIQNRYPFDSSQTQEITIGDFNDFFAPHGTLNNFIAEYLKPFIDTSQPDWQLKVVDNYVLPISPSMMDELIRANIINNMFFPQQNETTAIEFSLQKITLDPVVSNLQLSIGNTILKDTQSSESLIAFHWPQTNAKLSLNSIEGNHYELDELGPWAFFKILQKVNVLVDEQDSANLQILFEINGNSGRYLLKTQNKINPFTPGILNGFNLAESIV